ncbi:MAG TPA: SDR family NAD(P)-dependent oxidoreductase [Salinarimonas sp.]|nr:SDR family NAD(P)-dependent oxidoreductase [Salinarimonas sp.]
MTMSVAGGGMAGVAVISGATRGIGLAIARELASAGFRLSLGVRDPGAVPADLRRADVMTHAYDARDRSAAVPWIAATLDRYGGIDALVANAGIAPFVGLEDGTDDALDDVFEVNVKAPFRLIQACLPALKASGRGRVVTVASLSGKRVMGLNAGYQMSKHAVVALTHAVRRLGWEHGIRATALCPGFVDTDLVAGVKDPPREEMIDSADLARMVAMIVGLPNTAAVAELLVNCRYEHTL